jgi:rubrerythrin
VIVLTASTRPVASAALASDDARALFAREQLTFLLQLAYSGELAATRAYLGHRTSLRDPAERAELGRIIRDEVRHRHCVLHQLAALDAAPDPSRERKMGRVGRTISTFCLVGGWFFPMYGAGRLESQNVREYETAARLALVAGLDRFVEPVLEMAEVEWDHERYFRTKASCHALWSPMPKWSPPPPRETIRASFRTFERSPEREIHVVRAPRLVR